MGAPLKERDASLQQESASCWTGRAPVGDAHTSLRQGDAPLGLVPYGRAHCSARRFHARMSPFARTRSPRRGSRSVFAAGVVAVVLLGVGLACGNSNSLGLGALGACHLNSDCASGLVCALGACRAQCMTAADCGDGGACVTPAGRTRGRRRSASTRRSSTRRATRRRTARHRSRARRTTGATTSARRRPTATPRGSRAASARRTRTASTIARPPPR